jgi:hypothetical protein
METKIDLEMLEQAASAVQTAESFGQRLLEGLLLTALRAESASGAQYDTESGAISFDAKIVVGGPELLRQRRKPIARGGERCYTFTWTGADGKERKITICISWEESLAPQ